MPLTHVPDPALLLGETERWALVLNRDQGLLGRVFCLLKRPESDVAALTDAEVTDLWALVRRGKAALSAVWSPDHFNYAFLMNLDPQVHFHLIPRYRAPRDFTGATFTDDTFGGHYTVAPARELDEAGYAAIVAALRTAFAAAN